MYLLCFFLFRFYSHKMLGTLHNKVHCRYCLISFRYENCKVINKPTKHKHRKPCFIFVIPNTSQKYVNTIFTWKAFIPPAMQV